MLIYIVAMRNLSAQITHALMIFSECGEMITCPKYTPYCRNGRSVTSRLDCPCVLKCGKLEVRCWSEECRQCSDFYSFCLVDGVCYEYVSQSKEPDFCPEGECTEECEMENGKYKCWGSITADKVIDCIKPLFRKHPFEMEYTLSADEDSVTEIIENFDDIFSENTLIGSLKIPAGAFLQNEDSNLPNVKIQIKSLADSILEEYKEQKVQDTESNQRSLQKIHSVVLDLLKDVEASFEDVIKVILKIYKEGFPENEDNYCLAYYDEDNELWICIKSTPEEDSYNPLFYIITGEVDHFTPYAVIELTKDAEPTPDPDPDDTTSNATSLAFSLFCLFAFLFVKLF
ncbi:hypothetical protein M0812_12587 [Anaeramoeba flamelloides]|uniref:Uncharacterized protein n=1 Tax=Anaeramoeba flamelloides TaxID=1746091 RepID=A0AAV7ZP35_9EUKA|nr:hypothetical protein M0812_12587 [Anaeramoeba flamelloides]